MATGGLDANGIWLYGEDDSETTFSGLLNKLGDSVSDKFTGGLDVASGGTSATNTTQARNNFRVGLVNVSPTSVNISTGSGSANSLGMVTFTGATSVALNGVFTTTYERYIIQIKSAQTSTAVMSFRYRNAGTSDTSANYYTGARRDGATGTGGSFNLSAASYAQLYSTISGMSNFTNINVTSPRLAEFTRATLQAIGHDGTAIAGYGGAFSLNTTSTYDGIEIFLSAAGTFSGTIQVFGYNVG